MRVCACGLGNVTRANAKLQGEYKCPVYKQPSLLKHIYDITERSREAQIKATTAGLVNKKAIRNHQQT